MAEQSKMTVQQARRFLLIFRTTVVLVVFAPMGLAIYGLAHPVRHRILLILLATFIAPVLLTLLLRKSGIGGVLNSGTRVDTTSIRSVVARHPVLVLLMPIVTAAVIWGFLLSALGTKEGGDKREWLRSHSVLLLFWTMTPQIVLAYVCVALNAKYIGIYVAVCLVYMTVKTAIEGLKLENGVVRFFSTYKAQASPLVILTLAVLCCSAFAVLHFAVWSMWPGEYMNLHGMEDALYFSVVTMATVGYGDILPLGHVARWLCVAEILSGVLLLVVGVSASMTVWLQTNQPVTNNRDTAVTPEASQSARVRPGDEA